jgi:hypothetical protein
LKPLSDSGGLQAAFIVEIALGAAVFKNEAGRVEGARRKGVPKCDDNPAGPKAGCEARLGFIVDRRR